MITTPITIEPRASIFTVEQEAELARLKSYFPFRIVWGAVSDSGEFVSGASTTRRHLNAYLRKTGWIVAVVTNK